MFLALYFSFNFHSQPQIITFSWAYGWAFRPIKSLKSVSYMFSSCLFSFPTLGCHFQLGPQTQDKPKNVHYRIYVKPYFNFFKCN